MSVERRFSASFREADTDEPGLVLEDDGSVWLVDPNGSRTQLPSGGGGTPAGNDGEIQFNDSDAFGASDDFVWDESVNTLRLCASENGGAVILGNALGVQLQIIAANGDETHVGGELVLKSGDSDGQNGGDLTIAAGLDTGGGSGGNISIISGSGDGGLGEVNIRSGGRVFLDEADAIIQGGPTGGVQLYSGDNQYVQLDNDGLQVGATKLGFYQGAAVTQPVVPLTTPSIQDVVDALVALGLVAQHD